VPGNYLHENLCGSKLWDEDWRDRAKILLSASGIRELRVMRILQVSPYFFPHVGGQERHVWDLARSLVGLGHDVEIVSSDYPKSVECETRDGVKVGRSTTTSRISNNPICHELLFFLLKHSRDFGIILAHSEHAMTSLFRALLRTGENSHFSNPPWTVEVRQTFEGHD
jgi:hypothetical protein